MYYLCAFVFGDETYIQKHVKIKNYGNRNF